ncbi:MAG: glycine betaine ABC transporter substrate-binding protein [Calditrichia bacterium]
MFRKIIIEILLTMVIVILALGCGVVRLGAEEQLRVGSKKFTENIILGEIACQLAGSANIPATHRRELGGTRILWGALLNGDIDIYPEYTGTIQREILQKYEVRTGDQLRAKLAEFGVEMSPPLGFNNTYALGMKEEVAEKYAIRNISDLQRYPDFRFGFTNEFMDRGDGWKGLQAHYRLPQTRVRGLDHDLAYRGLQSGTIQVIDLYSTDAEIAYYNLRPLQDDRNYFPRYDAVYLYRKELARKYPRLIELLRQLGGSISERRMVEMNHRAKLLGVSEKVIASDFLQQALNLETRFRVEGFWSRLYRHTREHLFLVMVSLLAAIVLSIPLGILAVKFTRLERAILGIVGIIQTIPSLALLVFMIPLLGIGGPPAICALFLYSLLPIVRNTHAGIRNIPAPLIESAQALGLPPLARLRLVELPLASPTILAGIKTSAVINVGTATLGALIGAGGYGQPILTGIRLDNISLILQGAVPAALLALLVQGIFDLSEHFLIPRGLHLAQNN